MSKFVFNMGGLRELMKSSDMQSSLQNAGTAVATAAGSGYATDTHVAPFTAVCTVYPSTKEAGIDNMLHNTLLKAVRSTGLTLKTHPRRG